MVQRRHEKHWPKHLPQTLDVPGHSLFQNLTETVSKFPTKDAIVFYGRKISYQELLETTKALSSFLIETCKVSPGDRVLLDLQSSPQFVIGYYAILGCGAVVVPVSPMNVSNELEHYLSDSDARAAIIGQDLLAEFSKLLDKNAVHLIVAQYADYVEDTNLSEYPSFISTNTSIPEKKNISNWKTAIQSTKTTLLPKTEPSDLAAILYTSGTTGLPKGCMHSHETIMRTAVGAVVWEEMDSNSRLLCTAPMFHVTGMQHSLNAGILAGATLVILPRWNPTMAGALIERYGCTHWANVPTMVVDLLADPATAKRDLSSMKNIFGGGSSMPEAVAQKLFERCGIRYMEAYGMTETISQTHMNPHQELRKQCLGIPTFDTLSTVIDPETLEELGPNETGEIISSGPQVMIGYWQRDDANKEAFIDVEGHRFFRTGDLGRYDEDGFFYISDRLKRMINAAGYKVWPAEVEMTLYKHPGIKEVAIISSPDTRKGETVKAVVVPQDEFREKISGDDIINWARENMAAYKIPRSVEFIDALPRSGTGKIQWRLLQEKEWEGKS